MVHYTPGLIYLISVSLYLLTTFIHLTHPCLPKLFKFFPMNFKQRKMGVAGGVWERISFSMIIRKRRPRHKVQVPG